MSQVTELSLAFHGAAERIGYTFYCTRQSSSGCNDK